ncbi:WW domain-binding protein 1-like isoform X1 [Stylophora pistillata]|uniref:WW domain-binding protein 1-like isoform X1 n=1 Tax=Stylophora pistillata TaxID=50429 RepID=UPI000C0493B6|nr:WW domain-binding protein 1-like isoform X1 [Stylophora pistillata]
MKSAFVCLIFLAVLIECYGRKRCSYRRHRNGRYTTTYYRCASSEYCCATQSCCTYVYAKWYIWTVIVITFVIAFMLWWYYRYRYRRAHQVVVAQVPHTQAMQYTTVTGNVIRVPAGYTVYTPPGQATVISGGANFQHPAYPPQVYAHQDPPPPYTSTTVVKQGAFVSTST